MTYIAEIKRSLSYFSFHMNTDMTEEKQGIESEANQVP